MSRPPSTSRAGAPTASPERVVARVRRHGRMLILPVLLLVAVAGLLPYALGILAEDWQRWAVLALAAVLVVLGVLLPYLAWLTRRTTVTTRRVILRSGVFVRTRRDVPLARSIDIRVRQSLGQRVFGCGDVHMDAGQERPIVLHDVPRPALVQEALHELVDAEHARAILVAQAAGGPGSEIDGDTVIFGAR
ncbi:PH domain-containing protein [Agromyces intestinalis]|uniref:PH domain-containing protein n=1 Tax=Agromyces intestinalis TaxID=2592652 RepID=A0A5C1YFN0_9MICO|nr:PH domain-containing protein [Agromyces intestinalis]QEO13572.1 PH domain-containing protein [Agromyces intestinalis]